MSILDTVEDWVIRHTLPIAETTPRPEPPKDDKAIAFCLLLVVCALLVTCGVHYCGN
jgi:hypothetical protein